MEIAKAYLKITARRACQGLPRRDSWLDRDVAIKVLGIPIRRSSLSEASQRQRLCSDSVPARGTKEEFFDELAQALRSGTISPEKMAALSSPSRMQIAGLVVHLDAPGVP